MFLLKSAQTLFRIIFVLTMVLVMILAFFSCKLLDSNKGKSGNEKVFINLAKDSSWNAFDSLEIIWRDSVNQIEGVLFKGKPKELLPENKFQALGFLGKDIQLHYRGYKEKNLISHTSDTYNPRSPTNIRRDTLKTPLIARLKTPPQADAGLDQTVYSGQTVQLSGLGMDPLSGIKSLGWKTKDTAITLISQTSDAKEGKAMASFKAPNRAGDFKAYFTVTNLDSLSTVDSVVIHVMAKPEAYLSELSISPGILNEVFIPKTLHYTASLVHSAASVSILAKTSDSNCVVSVNGKLIRLGLAHSVALQVGANILQCAVKTPMGDSNVYTLQINRAGNGNNDLSSLILTPGTLSPPFNSSTVFYTLSLPNSVDSTRINAVPASDFSTLSLEDKPIKPGAPMAQALKVGNNLLPITVTAQSGEKKVYMVMVTRAASNNADLAGLVANVDDHSLQFTPRIIEYKFNVSNALASLIVTAWWTQPKASVTINGIEMVSYLPSDPISLKVGDNIIRVVVTAEDNTQKTYTLTITRVPDENTELSELIFSAGELDPPLSPDIIHYTVTAQNEFDYTTITPVAMSSSSTLKVNGTTVASGNTSPNFPLSVGPNIFEVVVTAQNNASRVYKVTVLRLPNTNLSGLSVSDGQLSPDFSELDTLYTLTVPIGISTLTVTPSVASEKVSTITVNGIPVASGQSSGNIDLPYRSIDGSNDISIQVTGNTGFSKTYRITVFQLTQPKAAAGNTHSLFIKNDGTLWATGRNWNGTLGDGTLADRAVPIQIMPGSTFSQIAVGEGHSLMLQTDGTLWAAGSNSSGQLGDGTQTSRTTPVQIMPGSTFSQIAAGGEHSLLLKTDGSLWATGSNFYGQLGDGTQTSRATPIQIMPGSTFFRIAAGPVYSLMLKTNASLWATGSNKYGQLGDGTLIDKLTPINVLPGESFHQITAGGYHSLLLKSNGSLWATGYNGYGQIGDGTRIDKNIPTPILPGETFSQIAVGGFHSLMLKTDGSLWATGSNLYGQLGDGSKMDRFSPVNIMGGSSFSHFSAGRTHTLIFLEDGSLWTMGRNQYGQLGDGTFMTRPNPVQTFFP